MKKLSICLIVCIVLFGYGCIINKSPDNANTIVMKPGDTQQFEVTARIIEDIRTKWFDENNYYISKKRMLTPAHPGFLQ
jgi:hypothetical protein